MSGGRSRGWKVPQETCGKLGYRSERHALRALEYLRGRAEAGCTDRRECRVYLHNHGHDACAMWHITSLQSAR